MIIIGVDTGGTFTDFIYKTEEGWGVYKLLSTPHNPAEAVLNGIKHITANLPFQVTHGSTVATNAILERKGAVTALITNKGFEDVIAIGRQNRSELYNLSYQGNPPLIAEDFRYGVNCRIDCNAAEVITFDDKNAKEIVNTIKNSKVESVAICFLFSFLNPEHEIKMKKLLEEINIPVSMSHEILSEFREYERLSTTVINAYVSPKMKRYINNIIEEIGDNPLRIMQSNGGSISATTAMNESVRTILSGPAGGAVGAFEISKMAGYNKVITFDMGGTSTDVALIDGKLPLTLESTISEFPVKVPMIDIHTVGAGGGSIAKIDAGGSLTVGPESAGADPGPICYGKGEEITVTDANLFLGRLIPERFLGGEMKLDFSKLEKHFNNMAEKVGLSPVELAEGVLSVANTAMERAIRVISVERGFDPREFVLFSFGGAGGLHAVSLARLLNIPKVFIPKNPGILSAIGMLMADIIKDYSNTIMKTVNEINKYDLKEYFSPLIEQAVTDLNKEGIGNNSIIMEYYLDMRYKGQSYEIIVPIDLDIENYSENFHKAHEKTYGYANENKTVEIVNIRLRARGLPEKPVLEKLEYDGEKPDISAFYDKKDVIFDNKKYEVNIIDRNKLKYGNKIFGPAIVTEYTSTIVLPPDTATEIDEFGNMIINV
jgi:N-methylhydantoinase A